MDKIESINENFWTLMVAGVLVDSGYFSQRNHRVAEGIERRP